LIHILIKFSRSLWHLLGIDRAIGFTVLARGWNIMAGALTILLIARFLSLQEQGYYYTFSSILLLQVVFELGFSFVVLQLAAHESARLQIHDGGQISGDEAAHSRLASILQKSVRWYSVAAFLMAAFLLIAGFRFFSTQAQSSGTVGWKLPWIVVVLAVMVTFQMDPVFSFLEGCGFVAQVAHMRFTQGIIGTTLAFAAFMLHRGLYAPAAVIVGQAVGGAGFLISKRHLLLPLMRRNSGSDVVSWRTEIWPFQWKMSISYLCSCFILPLINPVLFAYKGAAEAGRMGMSLSIVISIGNVAIAWINTKASPFGQMIARRDFATLDRVFFRALMQSGGLLLAGETVILSAVVVAERYFPHLALRIIPIPQLALLMLTVFLIHLILSEALYLRAHQREPFLVLSITVAMLTGLSTLPAGRLWGTTGVTIGFFLCSGVFQLVCGTYIFMKCRSLWHGPSHSTAHKDAIEV
jgi:hypothetical protein